MKIRKGFVSNSSSSSFICDVCGEVESGMDAGLEEFGMCECVNGHTLHEEELLDNYNLGDDDKKETSEDEDSDEDPEDEERYNVAAKHCPICMLKIIPDKTILEYVYKHYKQRKELEDLIRLEKGEQK